MSWRSALWDNLNLADADVTVEERQTDTSVAALENAGAGSLKANWRTGPRYAAAAVPAITAVTLSGEAVTLVNISSSGVLVESSTRFKPGERVRLGITGLQPNQLGGVIVRCMVSAISTGGKLRYESAIAFSQQVNLPVPAGAKPTSTPAPAAARAPVAKPAASAPVASTPESTPATTVPTAPTPTADVLLSEEVVVDFPPALRRVRNRW